MTFMSWRRDYELGIDPIDGEHRRLFDLVNESHDVLAAGGTPQQEQQVLSRLVAYAEEHFQNEERLMRESAFPGLAAHQALHEALIDRIFDLNERRAAASWRMGMDTLSFLKHWLLDHVLREDMEFADFLRRWASRKGAADASTSDPDPPEPPLPA